MLNRDPSFVPPAILPVALRRAADRRRGISALTTAVTTGLALTEPRAARERLEEELRCALQARSVRLRDDSAQAVAPPPDAVCFDVPASPGDSHARLEVIFDKPRPLDDWTCQLIEAATQLSLMVLELETHRVAVLVDEVREVIRVDTTTITAPGPMVSGLAAAYISGIITRPGRTIIILNARKLLSATERLELDKLGAA